jgi:hypothetical protein
MIARFMFQYQPGAPVHVYDLEVRTLDETFDTSGYGAPARPRLSIDGWVMDHWRAGQEPAWQPERAELDQAHPAVES